MEWTGKRTGFTVKGPARASRIRPGAHVSAPGSRPLHVRGATRRQKNPVAFWRATGSGTGSGYFLFPFFPPGAAATGSTTAGADSATGAAEGAGLWSAEGAAVAPSTVPETAAGAAAPSGV